ncbi:hypothetical protein GCM10027570_34670 [Streptomonospora sediminis]
MDRRARGHLGSWPGARVRPPVRTVAAVPVSGLHGGLAGLRTIRGAQPAETSPKPGSRPVGAAARRGNGRQCVSGEAGLRFRGFPSSALEMDSMAVWEYG